MLGAFYNHETNDREYIPVEEMVRRHFTGVPNVYGMVHFACCREISKISDIELEKIKKEFEEKAKKLEEEKMAKELEETK